MDSFIDKFAQRKNAQEMIKANAMAEAEEKKKMAARISEYEQAMQEMRKCSLLNMENAEKVREALAASLAKIEEVRKKDEAGCEKPEKTAEEVKMLLEQLSKTLEEQRGRTEELLKAQDARMQEQLNGQDKRMQEQLDGRDKRMQEQLDKQDKQMQELLDKQDKRMEELLAAQTKAIEELLHASDEFDHKEAVKVYRNVQAVIEGALPKQTEDIRKAIESAAEKQGTPAGMTVVVMLTFVAAAANVVIEIMKLLGYL